MRRLWLLAALVISLPLFAKSLHWKSFDVEAHLDRDARLHVLERQAMVFDGDWNGGERIFNLRSRQEVVINRITRIENGVETPVEKCGLGNVNCWNYGDTERVVRWRSRLASDPPFENREITYLIDATYSNILVPLDDGNYELAHDFGMPDRSGVIENYSLHLTFDPVWQNAEPATITAKTVVPGESAVVKRTLHFNGTVAPAAIEKRLPKWVGWLTLLFLAAAIVFLVLRFINRETEHGRFAPLVPRLDEDILELDAEVAGAAWDRKVGPPEVAAVLARLAQEKKIETHVENGTLHMKLLVHRSDLTGYERTLVSAMFINGDSTDTDRIRTAYANSGFDPASKIRDGVEASLGALHAWGGDDRKVGVKKHVWTILAALAALIVAAVTSGKGGEIVFAFMSVVIGGIFGGIACGVAKTLSKSVTRGPAGVLFGPLLLLAISAFPLLLTALAPGALGVHTPMLAAQWFWFVAWAQLVLDLLLIRDSRQRVAYRKRVAGLRQFFVDELAKPKPALHDAWYPHLLAFGLGRNVDRWFHAHAAPGSVRDDNTWSSSSSSSSSSTSSNSSPSWTGGGGAFGGAGASGSWAVAAAGMASGVSAPSSSGSGGGGGSSSGGSSSGGGGGGGW